MFVEMTTNSQDIVIICILMDNKRTIIIKGKYKLDQSYTYFHCNIKFALSWESSGCDPLFFWLKIIATNVLHNKSKDCRFFYRITRC